MSAANLQQEGVPGPVSRLGFWSASLATFLCVLWLVLAFAFSPAEWTGIEAYARGFDSLQMLNFVPVLLMAPAVVVMMASIHVGAPRDKKLYSLLGVLFSAIYAAIICTNYYVQLVAVRLNVLHGDMEGLALLAMPNFRSVFFALEALGYTFLSLATLSAAPVFTGSRVADWIRRLFVANALLSLFGVVVAPFDLPMVVFAGLWLWALLFPTSTLLVALYFRNLGRGRRGAASEPSKHPPPDLGVPTPT